MRAFHQLQISMNSRGHKKKRQLKIQSQIKNGSTTLAGCRTKQTWSTSSGKKTTEIVRAFDRRPSRAVNSPSNPSNNKKRRGARGEIRRFLRGERETNRLVKSMPSPKLHAQSSSSFHLAEDLLSSAALLPFIRSPSHPINQSRR